jgi:hypothetical protein
MTNIMKEKTETRVYQFAVCPHAVSIRSVGIQFFFWAVKVGER